MINPEWQLNDFVLHEALTETTTQNQKNVMRIFHSRLLTEDPELSWALPSLAIAALAGTD